jgi:hypothetical protein
MKVSTDYLQERQLKLQRFRQLAESHAGLVIASQLAAKPLAAESRDPTDSPERQELPKGSRRAYPLRQR